MTGQIARMNDPDDLGPRFLLFRDSYIILPNITLALCISLQTTYFYVGVRMVIEREER